MFHLSARLAWHMDGWNGHICTEPAANTYCVGPYSYPGTMIADDRVIDWEEENKGRPCSKLNGIPPCIYSINAFSLDKLTAYADPPDFFNDGTTRRQWELPPATVCVWPYEEMYANEMRKAGGGYDNEKRLTAARNYFSQLTPDEALYFIIPITATPSVKMSRKGILSWVWPG
ncbi:MAG: hypothetical protein PHO01_02830 [Desulfotomaculaceae bacterium]|nr:hypothetical protein [Desulfotomaculaceae bacterium]